MYSLEKKLLYLIFFIGFFGAAFFSVNFGLFSLFPYRFFLLSLTFVFFLKTLLVQKIVLNYNHIKIYIYFLFSWLLYSFISMAWAASKGDAIKDITFLLMSFLLIYFSIYYFSEKNDFIKLYNIWLVVLCILILIGFWERMTGSHLSVSKLFSETRPWVRHNPTGTFHNPNDYATYIALSIPFVLAAFRYIRKKYIRIFCIVCFFASFYLIVSTGSRANIIAVLFEILFIFVFLMNINKKIKFLISFLTLIIIFSVMFPLGNVYQLYNDTVTELNSLVNQLKLMEGSMGVRVNLIKNGLHFLYSTVGFGVGAGNAEYYMEHYSRYNTGGILNPHNWWLEILVNYGVIMFFGYISFYIGIIMNLWKICRKNILKFEKMICEALLVSLVGFFFASISSSSIMAFKPQWLLFAFALSYLNYFRNKEEKVCI